MRRTLLVLLVACSGGASRPAQQPVSNSPPPSPPPQHVQIAQAPPPPPEMPVCSDDDMGCVVTKMEYFSNQMCACQDWPCAEKVNEGLTQWGQQLAKSGVANKKPDPAHANRATEVMIRYGDCMTKLVHQMTPDPDPCAGSDPCAGD